MRRSSVRCWRSRRRHQRSGEDRSGYRRWWQQPRQSGQMRSPIGRPITDSVMARRRERTRLVMLEKLHRSLVLHRFATRVERAEVATLAGPRVLLAGIETEFA